MSEQLTVESLWKPAEVASYLRIPVRTLYQWRYLGKGPAGAKLEGHLRWEPAVVRQWVKEREG